VHGISITATASLCVEISERLIGSNAKASQPARSVSPRSMRQRRGKMMEVIKMLTNGFKLERYNVNSTCPKCGGSLTTRYRSKVMHRECMRCGYEFDQLPLDVDENKSALDAAKEK
jgi:DNA-directed RNA polymerase subunit M/transcription elongation factor TFIIS